MNRHEPNRPVCSSSLFRRVLPLLCLAITGCNLFTQQNLVPCSGSYSGTFNGTLSGMVTGSLSSGSSLSLTFTPSNAATLGVSGFSYQVSGITGTFTGKNPDDVSGTFDSSSCRISGLWTFQGNSGVYTVTIVRP